jgi:hypothetical protein
MPEVAESSPGIFTELCPSALRLGEKPDRIRTEAWCFPHPGPGMRTANLPSQHTPDIGRTEFFHRVCNGMDMIATPQLTSALKT